MVTKTEDYLFEPEINTRNEVYDLISWWKKDRVRDAKILVIGAGALGNEVLKNLALLNIGHILIVDFDTIEFSNLSRSLLYREADAKAGAAKCDIAAARVKEMNPEVKVSAINADIVTGLGLGIYRRMDAIIGCLDNRLARLAINRACHKINKPWVDGAIENLAGQAVVYVPGASCYECELSEREKQIIKRAVSCKVVANRSIVRGRIPTTPISASIIGAIQAQEALKLIHGYDETSSETYFASFKNKIFRYDGKVLDYGHYDLEPPKADCMSHDFYDTIIEAPELSAQTTVAELLVWIKGKFNEERPEVILNQQFIYELIPDDTKITVKVQLPENQVGAYIEANNLRGETSSEIYQSGLDFITKDFPYKDLTLNQVGIPPLDILKIETEHGIYFAELTGDEQILNFK